MTCYRCMGAIENRFCIWTQDIYGDDICGNLTRAPGAPTAPGFPLKPGLPGGPGGPILPSGPGAPRLPWKREEKVNII